MAKTRSGRAKRSTTLLIEISIGQRSYGYYRARPTRGSPTDPFLHLSTRARMRHNEIDGEIGVNAGTRDAVEDE